MDNFQKDILLGFTETERIKANEILSKSDGTWKMSVAREVLGDKYDEMCDILRYYCKINEEGTLYDAIDTIKLSKLHDDICVEEITQLGKHFQKMHSTYGRGIRQLTNDDFVKLGIREMTTLCVCRNLEEPFDIYNKDNYQEADKGVYHFVKKGSQYSLFRTKQVPNTDLEEENANIKVNEIQRYEIDVTDNAIKTEKIITETIIKNRQAELRKEIAYIERTYIKKEANKYGFLEERKKTVKNVVDDGTEVEIKINNENIGVKNRFMINISTKSPVSHCGMIVILTSGGTRIFIYAIEFNGDLVSDEKAEKMLGNNSNKTIKVGYGYTKKNLETQLENVLKFIYSKFAGKLYFVVRPEHEFEEKINWLKEPDEVSEW